MGCNASKLDSLPAVSLCHHRFHLIDESLRHSYSFADSHLSYLHSLHTFPTALLSFLRHNSAATNISSASDSPPNSSDDNTHSKSDSSSDLNFSSSSSDSLSDDEDNHKPQFGDNNGTYDFHHPKYDSYGGGRGDLPYPWRTPSPPQPRASSAWDFLNFFDAAPFVERYDNFAVKDKEEVNKNRVDVKSVEKKKLNVEKKSKKREEAKDSCPKHGNPIEKKKVQEEEKKKESDAAALAKVMEEVDASFQKTAECGNRLLSKSPSFPDNLCGFDGDDESRLSSLNLSSTLSRLCVWEKKLYDEVKAAEKLRMAYARCCNKMRKGLGDTSKATEEAVADRVDESVRATLRTLANQIQVGIQVIDRISTNINKLRDDELFPQLTDLIHTLFGMWESMLESHRAQFRAVSEAQSRNLLALSSTKLSDAGLESAIQLKIELQSLALRFILWVSSPKRCVKSLNGWLLKCLLPDKPAEKQLPRGAESEYPPVFALCEKWSSSLDSVSETEVLNAIQALLGAVNKLIEQQHVHVQELMTADKILERKVKGLEREELRLKKLLQGHGIGKMVRKAVENEGFEFGLKQVFKSIERFSATSFEAYQQLRAKMEAGEKPQEISSSS